MPSHTANGCALLMNLVGRDMCSVPELLRARALRTPNALFIENHAYKWTFAQVLEMSERVAGYLDRLSHQSTPLRVASWMPPRPEEILIWFGTLLIGGVFIGINYSHIGPILQDQLERSRADVLFAESTGIKLVPDIMQFHKGSVVSVPDERAAPAGQNEHFTELGFVLQSPPFVGGREISAFSTASIVFTSGTTGRSKAVLVPHNQLCRGGARVAEAFELSASDRCHDWSSLAHIGGQLNTVMSALVAGAALVVFPRFSARNFWVQVSQFRTTYFTTFASVLYILMEQAARADDAEHTLRLGMFAGGPEELLRRFEARFGIRLVDSYGMTEAEPIALRPFTGPRHLGSVGRVNPDFEVEIMDEQDNPMPLGQLGRIVVRPRAPFVMMTGYEEDESATVTASRNLWFHTQDFGRLDKCGNLFFVGRSKDTIRRRGENISPFEVESVLLGHPDVLECVVVGVPSSHGDEDVKAVVRLRSESLLQPLDVYQFSRQRLAPFMTPRFVEFRTEMPYSDIGKVKRDLLVENSSSTWDAHSKDELHLNGLPDHLPGGT